MNLSILLLLVALVPAETTPPPSSVQDLAWLSGCWALVGGEPGSGESWTAPAGGTLLGVNRTVKGGKTVAYEFLQIRETGPGQIAFIALPSGQKETSFPLVRLSAQEAVFENPQHDFPQRVIYRRDGEDLLTGRIEGREGGETKGIDFPMKRCPRPSGMPSQPSGTSPDRRERIPLIGQAFPIAGNPLGVFL